MTDNSIKTVLSKINENSQSIPISKDQFYSIENDGSIIKDQKKIDEIKSKLGIRLKINDYKIELMQYTKEDILFIRSLRKYLIYSILFAFIFTCFILYMSISTWNVSKEIIIVIVTGMFTEIIGLLVIIVKFAFNPIEIMLKHIENLIEDDGNYNK